MFIGRAINAIDKQETALEKRTLRRVQIPVPETDNSMAGCLKGGFPVNVAEGDLLWLSGDGGGFLFICLFV